MPRYKRPAIHDLGLKPFLLQTYPNLMGEQYPDIAYDLFTFLVNKKVNSSNIGRVFGRTPNTINQYRLILREEQTSNEQS